MAPLDFSSGDILLDEQPDTSELPDFSAGDDLVDETAVSEPSAVGPSLIGQGAEYLREGTKAVQRGAINMPGMALRGVSDLGGSLQYQGHEFDKQQFEIMDRIDSGEAVPEMDDPMGYQHMNEEQRAAARLELERTQREFAPTPLEERPLRRAGEAVSEFGREMAPVGEGWEDSLTAMFGEGLGSFVGGMPAAGLGRLGAAAFFGTVGAGEAGDRAIGADATEAEAVLAARYGVIPGVAELAPLELLFNQARVPMPFRKPLLRAIGKMGLQGFVEAVQEGGAGVLQNIIAREIYAPEQDLLDEVPEESAVGGAVGLTVEGMRQIGERVMRTVGPRRRGAEPPPQQEQAEVPPQPAAPQQPAAPDFSAGDEPVAPAAPVDAAQETALLRGAGYSAEDIADMSAAERAAEAIQAAEQGVVPLQEPETAPGAPEAPPAPGTAPMAPRQPRKPAVEPEAVPETEPAAPPAPGTAPMAPRRGDGSRVAPVVVEQPEDMDAAAQGVNPEPSDAQVEADNYKMGHARLGPRGNQIEVSIENPKGGIRRSRDPKNPWEVTMPAHYGRIKGTVNTDGEQMDVFVGDEPSADRTFVIAQNDAETGKFDEYKVMVGFPDEDAAVEAYEAAFSDDKGSDRLGSIEEMSWPQLAGWLEEQTAANRKEEPDAEAVRGDQGRPEEEGRPGEQGEDVRGEDIQRQPEGEREAGDREAQAEAPVEPAADKKTVDTINRTLTSENRDGRGFYKRGQATVEVDLRPDLDDVQITVTRDVSRYKGRARVTRSRTKKVMLSEIRNRLSPAAIAEIEAVEPAEAPAATEPEKPAEPSTEWRVEPFEDDQGHKFRVARGKGDSQATVWGYYETAEAAEKGRARAAETQSRKKEEVPVEDARERQRRENVRKMEAAKAYGEGNKLVTKDRAAELRKRLKAKLDQVNVGIDPEVIAIGTELTVFHIEAGARRFMDVATALARDLETDLGRLRPYLRSWYNGARDMMEDAGVDVAGMDDAEAVRDALGDIDAMIAQQRTEAETPAPAAPDPEPEPPAEPAPAPEPTPAAAGSPQIRLANQLAARIGSDAEITPKKLIEEAEKAYGGTLAGGTFSRHDMHEALELAVNMRVKDHPSLRPVERRYGYADWQIPSRNLEKMLSRLPAQRVRSEEQVAFQQFSTPPHYALAAAYVANPRAGDVVLEPSAGTGSLVAAAVRPDVTFIANEIDQSRAAMLREVVGERGRVFTENAEQIDNVLPADVKPTLVVMNPPFSQTAGRMRDKKDLMVGAKHIEQALARLEPGGRLVAIVGRGMSMGAPRFRQWWQKIGRQHDVRANIAVDGAVYAKYGTTFGTRLLVIDKVAPTGVPPVLEDVQTVDDLMRLLEPIKDARPQVTATEQQAGEPGRPGVPEEGEGVAGAALPPPPDTGLMGPGAGSGGGVAGAGPVRPGGTDEPAAGVGAGERPGVAVQQPERPGQPGAGGDAGAIPAEGFEPGGGRGARPERDVQPDAERDPSPTTVSERIELENAAPGSQAAATEITDSLYEDYQPQRVRVKGAKPHPGPLVQSAAMASVNPPKPTYKPALPPEVISEGMLSLAQLEAIIYAGQSHEAMLPAAEGEAPKRRGHFIGDGTGVGKGREISGIVLDNWRQGRTKAVWVSEKKPLLNDARRDWSGVGQDPNAVFDVGKVKVGEPVKIRKGIAFTTYDTLKGGMSDQAAIARGGFVRGDTVRITDPAHMDAGKTGTVTGKAVTRNRTAYYPVKLADDTRIEVLAGHLERVGKQGKLKSRIDQLADWLGEDFDGVIAFDEAHNMGNAMAVKGKRGMQEASQKALAGIELQARLPNARVVYVSATGATEVSNLAYADRLGLWGRGTPFAGRNEFVSAIEGGGIAAMELVARDMKQLGLYTARGLSYDGVEYERVEHTLDPTQRDIYDTLAEAWQGVLANFNAALEETDGDKDGKAKSAAMSAFWGAHQRFFNQIVTSMQMPSVISAVERDIAEGRQAVLQLTNTSEAAQERAASKAKTAEDIEDLDITPRDAIIQLVEKSFPTQQYETYIDDDGNEKSRPVVDSEGNPVQNREAVRMRDELIERLASIRVPQGPLDMVLDHFGVDTVAEVTGRKRRFVMKPDPDTGALRRVEDSRPGSSNLSEADAFQAGKKRILVFSQAGGTGRSYHADNESASKNARRAHYLVQAGWRADTAVQGFGRTHRTNQASAPIFRLVTTDLKGQKRFISSIARRLAQLGALTKGQRQAGDQGVFSARDNLESQEAHDALQNFYTDLLAGSIEGVAVEEFERQTGLSLRQISPDGAVLGVKQDLPPIQQFLNRLLSLKIDFQNMVFDALSERIDAVIEARQQAGMLDVGLETVRADKIEKVSEQTVHVIEEHDAETKYEKLRLSRKFVPASFERVRDEKNVKRWVKSPQGKVYGLIETMGKTDAQTGHLIDQYRLYSPVSETRLIPRHNVDRGESKWEDVTPDEAEGLWEAEIASAPEFVTSDMHLITGAILPIWDRLKGSPRVVRMQTDAGERLIGRVIPSSQISATLKALGADVDSGPVTAGDLFPQLMDGARAKLSNGWTLKRSMVAGEHRIELTGPQSFAEGEQVKKDGAFTEKIDYRVRYFVPTDPERGPKVLAALTEFRPVVQVDAEPTRLASTAIQRAANPNPVFYSGLLRAIEGMSQPKGSPQQWSAMIQKAPGVKREELEWTGILDWLGQQTGSVTREEVADFVRANQIQVQDVTKGGEVPQAAVDRVADWFSQQEFPGDAEAERDEAALQAAAMGDADGITDLEAAGVPGDLLQPFYDSIGGGATKFTDYTIPGGENYRELLLTLPEREFRDEARIAELSRRINEARDAGDVERMRTLVQERAPLLAARQEQDKGRTERTFTGGHFEEPNVVAHVRFNEREVDAPLTAEEQAAIERRRELQPEYDRLTAELNDAIRESTREGRVADAARRDAIMERVRRGEIGLAEAKREMETYGGRPETPAMRRQESLYRQREALEMPPEPKRRKVKTLFIEEIQSDWHQKGRKQGYTTKGPVDTTGWTIIDRGLNRAGEWQGAIVVDADGNEMGLSYNEVEDDAGIIEQVARYRERTTAGVPDAPFKTTWPELAFKRVLRHAVDNGFDRVAWTPGDVQAERYDLSKHIDQIGYDKKRDGRFAVTVWDKGGAEVLSNASADAAWLEDTFGKEIAQKILDGEGTERAGRRYLQGLDLKVGGEGMKGFYDRILPAAVNKLVKRWGGKVGTTRIEQRPTAALPYLEKTDYLVHSLDITPEMRESIRGGMPLFRREEGQPDPVKIAEEERRTIERAMAAIIRRVAGREPRIFFSDTMPIEDAIDADQIAELREIAAASGDTLLPTVGGLWTRDPVSAEAIIAIALQDPGFDPRNSAYHEAFHHVEMALLSRSERAALTSDRELERMRAFIEPELGDMAQDMPPVEVTAIAFARYATQGEGPGLSAAVTRIFRKIAHALREIRRMLTRRGYERFEDIFDATLAGRFARRGSAASEAEQATESAGLARIGTDPDEVPFTPPDDNARIRSFLLDRVSRKLGAIMPTETRLRTVWQDRFLQVKRYQDAIKAQGGDVSEAMDTYLAESLYYGRAGERLHELRMERVEPLTEAMRAANITTPELDEYLYALHAPERNEALREVNPDIESPSGMSDAEAEDIVARIDADPRARSFHRLAAEVRRINAETRDRLLNAGLISDETHTEWSEKYEWYVPLRGFEGDPEGEAEAIRAGRGFDIRGPEARQALGRRSLADSPLTYSLLQAEQAIMRAEKNRVLKALLKLVQSNPNKAVWEINRVAQKRRKNPETGLVEYYTVPPPALAKELNKEGVRRVFSVKQGGKETYITLKDERLARAVRQMGNENMHVIMRAMGMMTRTLARLSTSWNPEFIISNAFRDLQTALIHLSETDMARFKRDVLRDYFKAGAGMYGYMRGDKDTEWQQYAHEFAEAGGKISFFDFSNIESQKSAIAGALDRGKAKRAFRAAFDLVENVNSGVENAVRLSTYVNLRRRGRTRADAASVARELTVNFNRKGEMGLGLNALYMFANAGIQGTTRMAIALRRSKTVRKIAVGMIGFGILVDMLNYLTAGDDDDEMNRWDKVEDWKTERNLVIMLPKGGPIDNITIPLPYGWNVPLVIGQQMSAASRSAAGYGDGSPAKAISNIMGAMIGSFMPIDPGGSFVQLMSPTVSDPFIQIGENLDWKGTPIAPQRFPGDLSPEAQRHWKGVHPLAKETAEALNKITGGNEFRSGSVDVSPEHIEHLVEFFTGGAGAFGVRTGKTVQGLADGEVMLHEVPFARRVAGTVNDYANRNIYYDLRQRVDAFEAEWEGLREAGRPAEAASVAKERAVERAVLPIFKAVEKELRKLRKQKNAIEAAPDMPPDRREKRLEIVEERIDEAMRRARQAWARKSKDQ